MIRSLAFSHDDAYVATGGKDKRVGIYAISDAQHNRLQRVAEIRSK